MTNRELARTFLIGRDLDHLIPIARRLARKAGIRGVTVANVKLAAQNAGLQLASTDRGYLSRVWGRVMIAAGLERAVGSQRRSQRIGTKGGNWNGVWRSPTKIS